MLNNMKLEYIPIEIVEKIINKVFEEDTTLTIGFNTIDGGMMYLTEEDKIIYLNKVSGIFDLEKLGNFAKIAEELYEGNNKFIQMCLLGDKDLHVTISEMTIPSNADFSIKLACMG